MAGDVEVLPPIREELDLFAGPTAFDGAPTWSLYDPACQRYYRIGRVECEMLMAWGSGTVESVLKQVNQSLNSHLTEADVKSFFQFLFTNNLLQLQGADATQFLLKQASAARQHWLTWLIHHYLFFKIPLIRPDPLLKRTYRFVSWLYQPIILYLLVIILMLNFYVLIDRWEMFSNTFLHFFTIEGFVYYFFTLALAKVLHEMGHAYTAHRYGCRVASMGVAFLVMFPVLYTDTSDAWKLTSRRQRLAIGAGGIAVELALAIICTSLWHFLPDGALRSSVFLMASTTWVMTLLINLNPFMRFDGYFLLSDFLSIENLQNRAFALGRWQLRRILFALKEPLPELLPNKMQRILIFYAWGTWIYRFLLFLGIALLVYHFFFKALGIVLMLVEIIWFIGLPIYKEIKHWLDSRDYIDWNRNSLTTALLLAVLLIILFVPWHGRVQAPAILKAATHTEIYMPLPGKLSKLLVSQGEYVIAGQPLIEFSSTSLDNKISQSRSRVKALRWQLSFHGQEKRLNLRRRITSSELETALSEYKSLLDERDRLVVVAPFSGVVLGINDQLNQGQWVAQDETLLAMAKFDQYKIEAYVNEDSLAQVLPSKQAVFYPDQLDWPSLDCQIERIDNAASVELTPVFASRYAGEIPIKGSNRQKLVPETSVYRIWLKAERGDRFINRAIRGNVMINVPAESIAGKIWKQVMSVLIRESGF